MGRGTGPTTHTWIPGIPTSVSENSELFWCPDGSMARPVPYLLPWGAGQPPTLAHFYNETVGLGQVWAPERAWMPQTHTYTQKQFAKLFLKGRCRLVLGFLNSMAYLDPIKPICTTSLLGGPGGLQGGSAPGNASGGRGRCTADTKGDQMERSGVWSQAAAPGRAWGGFERDCRKHQTGKVRERPPEAEAQVPDFGRGA